MKTKAISKLHLTVIWVSAVMLFNNVLFAQSGFPFAYGDNVFYYPKLKSQYKNLDSVKLGITLALQHVVQIYDVKQAKTINVKNIKSVTVSNDRIEMKLTTKRPDNLVWLFSEIDDSTMFFFANKGGGIYVTIPLVANFGFSDLYAAQQLADNFYAIQYPRINYLRDSILHSFKEKVKEFRNSNKVATLKAEQQKLLENADSACASQNYFEAIRIYLKAIEINEMSYPTSYANLALLYAHINYFDYAILYLKKYLMLELDVVKVRKSLDKLYEWEGIIHY